jgi:RNA-directed DNA polymerase
MRQWVRRPADGKAKIWQPFGQRGRSNLCGVTLRRLVTSRKHQFRWRNPEINPYIILDKEGYTLTSRYRDVAMAMSHAAIVPDIIANTSHPTPGGGRQAWL